MTRPSARLTVMQVLPALEAGGVERGTVDVARALQDRGHHAVVVSAGGRLVPELHAAGARHIPVPVGRKSLLTLRHVVTLRRLIRETGADILHLRSRLPAWIAWLAWRGLPASARPRLVTTVHGPYSVNPYSGVMMRGERVIAISEFIRGYIRRNYPQIDAARVRLIYRGISDADWPRGFRPAAGWLSRWHEQNPMLEGRALVTLPARITRWKGHEDFLLLLARLRSAGVDVHGLVVGGAEARRRSFLQHLQREAAAREIADRISFLGHRDDLREIMAVSSVVVSLARAPEAFGRTALEALSLGVPVVACDHGGAGEILRAMFPAGLVPPGDLAAAARLVETFCRERPAVTAANPFTLERMLDETIALYQELAADQSP